MPFNGSGTFTLVSGNPVVNNTVGNSTVHNNTNSDIATGLSNTLTKDGQSTPTANIPFGGYEATNLGDGTALTSAATVKQLQNNGAITLSSVTGTDTITATVTPVPSAYASGQIFVFEPAANNTGAATINISSLGAKDIYLNNAAIGADVLVSGQPVVIRYNGTQFEIIGKADFASLNAASNQFAGDMIVDSDLLVGVSSTSGFGSADRQSILNGSTTARFEIGLGGSPLGGLVGNSSGLTLYTDGADDLNLQTNSTSVMRLTDDGFFKQTSTGTFEFPTSARNEFTTNETLPTLTVKNKSTSASATCIDAALDSGATGNLYNGSLNGVQQFEVASDGDVKNTNNSYGSLSDRELKNLIEKINNDKYLDKFKKLQFWTYTLISDPENKKMLGVVAQELQEIMPSLVRENEEFKEVIRKRTKTKKVQKTESVKIKEKVVVVENGKHVLKQQTKTIKRPAYKYFDLFDEKGNPVIRDGQQLKVKEPVYDLVKTTEEYIEKIPTGKKILSVKYSILYLINVLITQNLLERIEKLESAQ